MKRWLLRTGCVLSLGWSLAASTAWAQAPRTPGNTIEPVSMTSGGPIIHDIRAITAPSVATVPAATNLAAPVMAATQVYGPTAPINVPVLPPADEPRRNYPIVNWLNRKGFVCWARHEAPTC